MSKRNRKMKKTSNNVSQHSDDIKEKTKRKRKNKAKKENTTLNRSHTMKKFSTLNKKKVIKWGLLVLVVLIFLSTLLIVRKHTWHVEGNSMAPTLKSGELVYVKKRKTIKRFDVVTFKDASDEGKNLVKRIVGMPGDELEIRGNWTVVTYNLSKDKKNDFDTLLTYPILAKEERMKDKIIKIPKDQYFVVGDNILHSKDSRNFGLIKGKQIEGTILFGKE